MVRDFVYGAIVGAVLGCSSESPGMDGGKPDALIGPDTAAEAATLDADTPDVKQDAGIPESSAGDERPYCGQFIGILPDADPPVPCTGSNWSLDDVNGTPIAPCSAVVCPAENGRYCTWNGAKGYVCCPGFNCK